MAYLLLLFLPLAAIAVFALLGYGCGTLGRLGVRQAGREIRLRCAAAVLAALAVGMYAWGMLHVAGAVLEAEDGGTSSSPIPSCRTSDEARWYHVIDYHVSYLPLRFVCETTDGGGYTPDTVPGYVGPSAALLALAAAGTGATAAIESERRATRVRRGTRAVQGKADDAG
ncbi:hypothetical protein [Streptomyces nitrosporeus]|uniref:hypothetical protein n=1 Tax=Streptomyces nitrosporeus TaxID=28894 RepID=UPI00331D2086